MSQNNKPCILVINAGSSSIKFAVFLSQEAKLELIYKGEIDNVTNTPRFRAFNASAELVHEKIISSIGHKAALDDLLAWLNAIMNDAFSIAAIGHRIVHGGTKYTKPAIITRDVLSDLEELKPLAPLHEPYNLLAIEKLSALSPKLPQVACFDTSFHTTQNRLAQAIGLPKEYEEKGIIKYGFHGLSYEYIANTLPEYIGNRAAGRVVVMHLGNGSSMCAIKGGKSIASTMGFSTLEGLMMGTRPGRLDPGVILYLLQELNMDIPALSELLYKKSGLLGISGISNDIRELLSSDMSSAKYAIDLYCYRAICELGSLIGLLSGVDTLVFTAGIGENAHTIRKKICQQFEWLGIKLNTEANKANASLISSTDSSIDVLVIPTNEEKIIAQHTAQLILTAK